MFYKILLSCLLILGSLFIGSNYYYYSPFYNKITHAVAVVHPTKNNQARGVVTFTQIKDGVLVKANIQGLKPGAHGFHIHEFGDCSCTDATCAGDHFNPTNQPHASPKKMHRHMGDLGNIFANENGIAQYDYIDNKLALNGPYSIIGRAVIIHENKDDLVSQPTGNAGARIGCGVIGIKKND